MKSPAPWSIDGYELREEIGRGGMGVVYRARDLGFEREVAIKFLGEKVGADSFAAARFRNEARVTGQLQHPGIPAAHEMGSLEDGKPFLVMKLVKGATLQAMLDQRSGVGDDRGRFIAIFEQICQAVGYAHAHQVIHRDLKPSNVMVGKFGEVQVMDWGLAKVLGEVPAASEARVAQDGTVDFRASVSSRRRWAKIRRLGPARSLVRRRTCRPNKREAKSNGSIRGATCFRWERFYVRF